MKKETMTEEKAKKTPAGGVLVGKREGQTIIHDKGTQGGYFVGKLHKEGGIKGINKSTGQPIEVQGGEVIITAPAVADQTKREFEGQMLTNREILSKINEKGGGVSLENGGEIYYNGSAYNYGGKTMTDYEIMQAMNGCGCDDEYEYGGLSKGKSLQDIADTHNVSLQKIKRELAKGKKVESEHTSDKKLAENIAKDHLYENPNYYTILDKVGLKDGGIIKTYKNKYNKKYGYPANESHDLEEIAKDTGISLKGLQQIYNKGIGAYKTNPESVRPNVKSKEQWAMARVYSAVMGGKASKIDANELKMNNGGKINLEKESKKGDHPSRDLNNYNDVLDLQADGMVGAETGLYNGGGNVNFWNKEDITIVNGEYRKLAEVVPSYKDDTMKGKYFVVFRNEKGKIVSSKDNFETYDLALKYAKDNVNNNENYSDGGDLDFLDDAVKQFDDGGSTTNEVDKIILESGSFGYFDEMPKKEYTSFKDFLSDLQSVFISKNKGTGYFYFSVYKNGDKIIPTRLAIQFKNSKNTVLNFNPLTGKASDFLKQIERRYGSTIRRNNLDFTYWLSGKSTPKPQPQPEPKKEKTIDLSNTKIWIGNNPELSERVQKRAFELGWKWGIGGVEPRYLNEPILKFGDDKKIYFSGGEKENFENDPEREIFESDLFGEGTKPEPKKEEVKEATKIDFEATKKYLNMRIADLSKELNFKRPRLSNEEVGFYQRDINSLIQKLRVVNEKELENIPLELRLKEAYSLKWGDINAEYTPANFFAPNGLPTKLTGDEWVNVRLDNFSSFFGDWQLANETGDFSGVSKVIDPETKEPMPVYHGTNVLFTEWKTYKTNNAHYFAKNRDFSTWFAEQWSKGRGDISARDSNLLKQLNPSKGDYVYRCFLDIKNPIDFSRFGVEKRPVSDFLMFLQINYNIGDFDFWTNFRLFNNLSQDTLVYSWMIIRNWQSFTEYIKMATTYDGYIFYEYHPEKVGTGLDGASLSFCAFDSNQIKFTNATEFNALINDSRFEKGGKL